MSKDTKKPGRPEDENVMELNDGGVETAPAEEAENGGAVAVDQNGDELPIDELLEGHTDPNAINHLAEKDPAVRITPFESLKRQLSAVCASRSNGSSESQRKNPLTCFLDGMEVPVRKAVKVAKDRGTLTDQDTKVLSDLIDVNLLNANIPMAQAAEIAALPGVLTPNELSMFTIFKEAHQNGENSSVNQAIRGIQKRKALTGVELTLLQTPLIKIAEVWLEDSLCSASRYTESGSHPEAIARMECRIADPQILTANVCLLENGHKETERISLAELIIIYEDAGLISAEDAVAVTSALTAKLAKLGLTPKSFQRKFESSKKNRIKDADIQERLHAIEELTNSPTVVSHYILNETTRIYEEASIGDIITALFEELDLLPEDEEKHRKPLEDKYNSKLEDLGRTREEVAASIPTPLGYLNGESTSRLSVFDVLHSDIEESRKDPNSTFTTYIETEYGLEEFPLLKAIALAVEMGYLSEELAQSLSKSCETAMLLASHRSGSKMTKPVMTYHKAQAKLVWRRIKEKKHPPQKYVLRKPKSTADLLEEKVVASEGELGNASFYPLEEILEARVYRKITREQAREFVERTIAACTKENTDSVVEAYALVRWILRFQYMSEALELLDLMPISEEDKRETRELLSDETPSAASVAPSPEEASDEFSVYNWQSSRGLTSSLIELDDDEKNIQRELRRAAISVSLREVVKSPMAILPATAMIAMLLAHIAIKISKEVGLQGEDSRMETYEQGPNGETIIKDDAGSIIKVYPPEPEEEQQLAMAVPSIPDTLPIPDAGTFTPEDISFPAVVVKTSTPLPEPAVFYASAIPDTSTGKPDVSSGEIMIAQPQIEKPAPPTLTPKEQASVIKTTKSALSNISTGVKNTGSRLASWMQSRIERTKVGVEKLRTQIAQYHQKEILELAQLVTRMQQKQMDAETTMAAQETLRSMTAKISQTVKSFTTDIISWTKTQTDAAKTGLQRLEEQIAQYHQKEVLELARLIAEMHQQQIEALKLVMATPIDEPREKDTSEIGTHGRRTIETVLTALPEEPPRVAQAPLPSPQEKPAAQPPIVPEKPAAPENPETAETINVQIPIATIKTSNGFAIDSAKSYALWKARGWRGSFSRTNAGAIFTIIIPDKKTGKLYKAEIPASFTAAQKTFPAAAKLIK